MKPDSKNGSSARTSPQVSRPANSQVGYSTLQAWIALRRKVWVNTSPFT